MKIKVRILTYFKEKTLGKIIWGFFFPTVSTGYLVRLIIVAVVAALTFRYLLIPCIIHGASMEPTFSSFGFTFCWRGQYRRDKPKRGDIVIIRYDNHVYYLKRVVGFPGETVAFRNGILMINGEPIHEPYVKYSCDWEMSPRIVKEDHYYVVGDNRSMPIEQHIFGQVEKDRVEGAPLWIPK